MRNIGAENGIGIGKEIRKGIGFWRTKKEREGNRGVKREKLMRKEKRRKEEGGSVR